MKAAAELVIDSAVGHLGERGGDHGGDALFLVRAYQSISRSMAEECGNLGALPNPPFLSSKIGQRRLHHHAHDARRKVGVASGVAFGIGEHVHGLVGGLQHFIATVAIGLGNRQQDLLETGPPVSIDGREVGSAVKRLAIGREKDGERPTAGAGDGRDRKLVTAVDIGTLVAIDLHRDEFAIDDFGDLAALVGLAVHDVTPVTPHRANVEQDRLVLALGRRRRPSSPHSFHWIGWCIAERK